MIDMLRYIPRRGARVTGATAFAIVLLSAACSSSSNNHLSPATSAPTLSSSSPNSTPGATASRTPAASSTSTTEPAPSATSATRDPLIKGKFVQVAPAKGRDVDYAWISATPLGKPGAPFHDGYRPANAVAFDIRVYVPVDSGTVFINGFDGFRLTPSHGGSSFVASKRDFSYKSNKTLMDTLCSGLPLLDDAVGVDSELEGGYTLPAGSIKEGCVILDYFDPAKPTALTYSDHEDHVLAQPIWQGHLESAGAHHIKPTTLASWSGYNSELLRVPKDARKGFSLRLCWSFNGSGNHILEGESTTSGSDLFTYTNTLGSSDSGCTKTMGTLEPILQVISETSWTIKVTGYRTG